MFFARCQHVFVLYVVALGLVCSLLFSALVSSPAAALSTNAIIVTAIIAPVHYAVVDSGMNIIKVYSNTSSPTSTVTFMSNHNSPVAATAQLYKNYDQILPHCKINHYGLIYDSSWLTKPVPAGHTNLVASTARVISRAISLPVSLKFLTGL